MMSSDVSESSLSGVTTGGAAGEFGDFGDWARPAVIAEKSTAKSGCATKANERKKEGEGRAEARPYMNPYKNMPIFRE
jgi:hypothetical protein